MQHELARGAAARREAETVDDVVETHLEHLEKAVFGCVADAVPLILNGGIEDAMSKFNGVKF